ncbi:MAG: long-chain fatty acid--CoA ligase [Candidatus Aminicenantes bacterium]|nr:long-chain fatty acid--CoA ligase [Candidatus Aminicenantes bacterium]
MTPTIPRLFLYLTDTFQKPSLLLYKKDGRYLSLSTAEVRREVERIALGLKDLGVGPGNKVILLAENSPWWVMTDYAILSIGAITVPIYPSLVPDQIKYIINDSDSKVVIVSDEKLWDKVAAIRRALPGVGHFVSFEARPADSVLPLDDLEAEGEKSRRADPRLFEETARSVKPDDLASIIYTSGTTGIPKGVMLTHANFASNVETLATIIPFGYQDTDLSFLPLSHVLERLVTFAFMSRGVSMAYAESVETVADNLLEVKPTIMVSVPRLFEKIYAKVMDSVLAGSTLKKKIFFWALKVGKEWGEKRLQRQPVPASLEQRRKIAHKLVFSKILEKTGGRVRFFVSGGAPLAKDIAEFFYALGIVVLEGYGLTESSPVIAANTFDHLKFGTVGQPIPGVEVKIGPDGEILAKGPNIMKGYYEREEETREALEGGWLHTGDIGHLDGEGFLIITDRKKDLIVTSGGKNVAPQPIENAVKQNPYIANAVVIGGSRKFISALIVPNFEKVEDYAQKNGIRYVNRRDLAQNEAIVRFLLEEVDRSTPGLAPYEKVKKIALLERDFEIGEDEITPTLKVKRNVIEQKYRELIDSLYRE